MSNLTNTIAERGRGTIRRLDDLRRTHSGHKGLQQRTKAIRRRLLRAVPSSLSPSQTAATKLSTRTLNQVILVMHGRTESITTPEVHRLV